MVRDSNPHPLSGEPPQQGGPATHIRLPSGGVSAVPQGKTPGAARRFAPAGAGAPVSSAAGKNRGRMKRSRSRWAIRIAILLVAGVAFLVWALVSQSQNRLVI